MKPPFSCSSGGEGEMKMAKIKVYLDTNMVHDYFVNQAKAVRKKEITVLPMKYRFMLVEKDRIEFVTSFITKAEIARELSSSFNFEKEEVERFWNDFIGSLGCKFIESFTFDSKIAGIASEIKMKLRTLFNFMHLIIAMSEDCYFVTGDKDMIDKIKKLDVYDKVMDYRQLRNLTEGDI